MLLSELIDTLQGFLRTNGDMEVKSANPFSLGLDSPPEHLSLHEISDALVVSAETTSTGCFSFESGGIYDPEATIETVVALVNE